MFGLRRGRARALGLALWLGAFLLLSCQPAQPVATPKAGETPAAAATTAKPAATSGVAAAEKPVKGGSLRLIRQAGMSNLDAHTGAANAVVYALHDALIQFDKDLGVTKDGLLRDWTASADGKTITFKLREGVKFHDGTDLDAAAVKFNIERVKNPDTKSLYRSNYDAVISVDAVDKTTVRFNLNQIDPILLARLGTQGAMMVSPTAVKSLGQDLGRKPVGSGPFQFVEWVPDDHITFKRFDGYWGKDKDGNQLPYLDQLVWQLIPDTAVAAANLRTGLVDVYATFPVEQLSALKSDPNLAYAIGMLPNMRGVNINTKRAPVDNKALRQAVALVLDREGLAAALGEAVRPQASVFHPMNWGADPKIGVFPARDVAKAKAKMAEAGYPTGGLKAKILAVNAPVYVRMAEVAKANLAEIGIDLEIEVLAQAAWDTRVQGKDLDYLLATGGTAFGLADPGYIFGLNYHSKGGRNYWGPFNNTKFDELIDKAGAIYDQKERTALYQEAAKIVVEETPFIPLFVNNAIIGMSKKVRNYTLYADSQERPKDIWLGR